MSTIINAAVIAKIEALELAGAHLANCAYNIAQKDALTDRDKNSLRESREDWDAALHALRIMT